MENTARGEGEMALLSHGGWWHQAEGKVLAPRQALPPEVRKEKENTETRQ
jgi:hypothetical protein